MKQALTIEQRVERLERQHLEATEFSGENSEKGKEVNRGLKDLGITKGEELAIIRKAIRHLISKYGAENDEELEEFINYDSAVENVKSDVSKMLNNK